MPKSTTRKYVYTALHAYELRTAGAGRIPELVQIPNTARFRINRPADDWPEIDLPPTRRWIAEADVRAAITRVRKSSTGGIPEAFERAACDAFALLGFKAQHIGGNGQPDGVLTAPLGSEGYRAVLECKTATPGSIVNNPRPEEAAKFREGARAQYSILLGPAFCHTLSFDDELKDHAVSVWTVDDLVTALEEQIGPRELREALEPGHADRAIQAILWERDHGRRKHVAVIAGLIERLGWQTQNALAPEVPFAEAPALTEETLFVLIDEALVHDGVTSGATRAEVEAALEVCNVRGVLHKTANGYIVETPPAKALTQA